MNRKYRITVLFNLFLLNIFNISLAMAITESKDSIVNNKKFIGYSENILEKPINPENTIIAFDLHEVIFEKIHIEMFFRAIGIFSARGFFLYCLNPFFLFKIKQLFNKSVIWEDFFNQLKREYPSLKRYDSEFYNIANAQRPTKKVVELIENLYNSGYKLYILSNIGGNTFELFRKKFPDLFKYFSGYYTPCENNKYICKPNILFYTNFKKYVLEQENKNKTSKIKQCIFIDDMEKNIKAAFDSNNLDNNLEDNLFIYGIRYSNIESLRKNLIDFGVLENI